MWGYVKNRERGAFSTASGANFEQMQQTGINRIAEQLMWARLRQDGKPSPAAWMVWWPRRLRGWRRPRRRRSLAPVSETSALANHNIPPSRCTTELADNATFLVQP